MIKRKIKYEDYLYNWLMEKRNYVKESTYANYSNIIFTYIIPRLGKYNLNSLNHSIIQKFILCLYDNGSGLSIKTIKDIMIVIKGSIRKAFFDKKIKVLFDLNFMYPKVLKDKKRYVLLESEQNKIVKYALNNINNKNVGILLSLFHGVRIGEVCALKWSDFNFNTNVMHINKTLQRIYIKGVCKNDSKIIITNPKSKLSNRDIPISKDFIKILKKIKTNKEDYVLTGNDKYIEPRTYRIYFNNILKKLNINHFSFHSLRHTFATNCISLGMDYKTVSEILDHSNVNITFNLYVHPSISEKKKMYRTII